MDATRRTRSAHARPERAEAQQTLSAPACSHRAASPQGDQPRTLRSSDSLARGPEEGTQSDRLGKRSTPGPLLIGVEFYVGCRTKLGFGTEKVSEKRGWACEALCGGGTRYVGRQQLSVRCRTDGAVRGSTRPRPKQIFNVSPQFHPNFRRSLRSSGQFKKSKSKSRSLKKPDKTGRKCQTMSDRKTRILIGSEQARAPARGVPRPPLASSRRLFDLPYMAGTAACVAWRGLDRT